MNTNSKQFRDESEAVFKRDRAASIARHWEDLTQKICPSMLL